MSSSPARCAEVIGVLAAATDLGLGLPTEHAVRTAVLAVELGRRAGLAQEELGEVYYLTLLRMLGCTVASDYHARIFGDEVAFGRDTQHLDYGDQAAFGRWVSTQFAAQEPPDVREQRLERLFSYTPERRRSNLLGHCEVAQMLATRLGMPPSVVEGVALAFERWDGTGAPYGVGGVDLPVGVRIMTLCNEIEVHYRLGGAEAAGRMVAERSGGAFDPDLVELFTAHRDEILARIEGSAVWANLLDAEPGPPRVLSEDELAQAASVIGDFGDLKSRYFAGQNAQVATLATHAAEVYGLEEQHRSSLRLAGHAHDLGRVGVTTAIWDRQSPLSDSDWEQIRLHPYYSERLLIRAACTHDAGVLAGLHHERCDGSGYHRGVGRAALSPAARLLAAAHAHVVARQARPHRSGLDEEAAGAALRRLAEEDRLEARAVDAVLRAAGDRGPRVRRRWPAGLTDREVDVLRQVAIGRSMQEAAAELGISAKTVDFHLQNVYAKTGVGTRAAATLFAVQSELIEP